MIFILYINIWNNVKVVNIIVWIEKVILFVVIGIICKYIILLKEYILFYKWDICNVRGLIRVFMFDKELY